MAEKKKMEDVTLSRVRYSLGEGNNPDFIVNDHIGMVMHGDIAKFDILHDGQIYRMAEGRLIMVMEGSVGVTVELEEQTWQKGDAILLANDSIIEVKHRSDDLDFMVLVFKDELTIDESLLLHTTASQWKEMLQMMYLMRSLASHEPFRQQTVHLLASTIVSNIRDMYNVEQQRHPSVKPSSSELLFRRFKKLVSQYCERERNIPFYAEQLYITPHHLSAVISRQSGKSVMYWINRASVLRAKVLLKSDDLKTNEIAERLNFPYHSTFTKFFKRETGMSPQEYRESI